MLTPFFTGTELLRKLDVMIGNGLRIASIVNVRTGTSGMSAQYLIVFER